MLVDSHAHIQAAELADDLTDVLERAVAAGIGAVVAPSTDPASAERAIWMTRRGLPVHPGVGIHPNTLRGDWARIEALAAEPEVVAIGETGLDYYRGRDSAAEQRALFRRHLELADRLGKPAIVHNREADEDVLAALADWGGVAVMHCFVGTPALAERALALGCYIGFGGPLTFKNAEDVRETARTIPLERVLIETDSPYLAPMPHRGTRNEPARVRLVAERLAEVLGVDFEKVERATTDNAVRVFGQQLRGRA